MPRKYILIAILFSLIVVAEPVYAGTTPPTTTATQTPSSPDGNNDWYVSPVQFDLEATDLESGVQEINYRVDGGTWQKVTFEDTLNLAPNPSFETAGGTSSGLANWEASVTDAYGTYSQDTLTSLTGYEVTSAKIETTQGTWHGINNEASFAVASPFENMTASVWLKTENVVETAFFKIFVIVDNGGSQTSTEIAQSATLTGTNDWTKLELNFVASDANAIGIFIDIGLSGAGIIWADAVSITSEPLPTTTSLVVATDSEDHTLEFYSVDFAGNAETYTCTEPTKNCIKFKIDQTPPGNWHESGAFRGILGPSNHHLYVYTNVDDATSGLSIFSDRYQYQTSTQPGYGRYTDLMSCASEWQEDAWADLISPPFIPGVTTAYLLTPKTDFCDSNWKICKTVTFYAEDMAGNSATKGLCLYGPWIKIRGEGIVRSNNNIDMLAEADGDNTDGLIEILGNQINFFSSSQGWEVMNSPIPNGYDYTELSNLVPTKTEITDNALKTVSDAYIINGDFEIDNASTPNDYDTVSFDQVVFIDGNLTITDNITVSSMSTALFIVSGNVEIDKKVDTLGVGIIADGDISTAHNIGEAEATKTLVFNGLYAANKFTFQRTLQGADNENTPSEEFNYEPKYLLKLKEMFGTSTVTWLGTD